MGKLDDQVNAVDPKTQGKGRQPTKSNNNAGGGYKARTPESGERKSSGLWEVVKGQGQKLDTLVDLVTKLVKEQRGGQREQRPYVSGGKPPARDKPYGVCWKCLEPGHFARECTKTGNKLIAALQNLIQDGSLGMVAPKIEDEDEDEADKDQEN